MKMAKKSRKPINSYTNHVFSVYNSKTAIYYPKAGLGKEMYSSF